MPYIAKGAKEALAKNDPMLAWGPGELNYMITKVCLEYFNTYTHKNYRAINDVLGALEGAKLEFYRRIAIPYEEDAIKRNGDIY